MRSNRRAVYPRILKVEEELGLDSMILIRLTGNSESDKRSAALLARMPSAFHCRTLSNSTKEVKWKKRWKWRRVGKRQAKELVTEQ